MAPLALAACLAFTPLTMAVPRARPNPSVARNATVRQNDVVRVVVGGSLQSTSPILDFYRGHPPGGVKYITAAGINPIADAASIGAFFADAGIDAEWIPVHDVNCNERTRDPTYVQMVEQADAIYMSGGQAGRVQSCLFGNYDQSGTDEGEVTPFLTALRAKTVLGGSSAGAMNQPDAQILITGHSAESYTAVRAGSVFLRGQGNGFLAPAEELVDVHFSERGRQGRLMVLAMETQREWAFGADENTAYIWRPDGSYEVVGEEGVVVYQGTSGDATHQLARMHFLTTGDRIDPTTGEITWAEGKVECEPRGVPAPSSSIFSGVQYRTISLAMAQAATAGGEILVNFHGDPAVQVSFFSRLSGSGEQGGTRPMCNQDGAVVSFANLFVEQFADAQGMPVGWLNEVAPELPLDHMWEIDM
jgi:cyanophycinase